MTKTKKKILGLALSASMIASCFTGMSISASAEPTGSSTYTVTIPSTLTVENSGWNSIGNISATGSLESGKKLTVTAASTNNWKLVSGTNNVSYTMKSASTDTAATTSWEFTELSSTATTKSIGIDVEDYSTKPAGTYTDTVTFTASVEDAVVIHTTLAVGDVIHLGEVLSISTNYSSGGQVIQSSKSPFTLVRANVTDDPAYGRLVTEAEDGQYYVLKGSDDSYCVYIGTPGTSKVEATSTSDGIIVNTLNGTTLYFTTHERQ